jgi:hypothetical protein
VGIEAGSERGNNCGRLETTKEMETGGGGESERMKEIRDNAQVSFPL